MAFSFGGSHGGMRGRRFGGSSGTLSEINVVPLVDVVLVLLIIFMLTAQAMEYGLEIKVPEVKHVQNAPEDHPVVSLSRTGKIYLNGKAVSNINLLGDEIGKKFKGAKAVYVQADAQAMVESLATVISELGAAHYDVLLVTKLIELPK